MNYLEVARRLSGVLQELEAAGIKLCSKTNFGEDEFSNNADVAAFTTGKRLRSCWYSYENPWSMKKWDELKPWERKKVLDVLREVCAYEHLSPRNSERAMVRDMILSAMGAPGFEDVDVAACNAKEKITYVAGSASYELDQKFEALVAQVDKEAAQADSTSFFELFNSTDGTLSVTQEDVQERLKAGADPNFVPVDKDGKPKGLPPLIVAAQAGRMDLVKILLEEKANPNISVKQGTVIVTPLSAALKSGQFEIAQMLGQQESHLFDANALFEQALTKKDYKLGRMLIREKLISQDSLRKMVETAITNGDVNHLLTLLNMGVSVDTLVFDDEPMIIGAIRKQQFEIVDKLITAGAKVDATPNGGEGFDLLAILAQYSTKDSQELVDKIRKRIVKYNKEEDKRAKNPEELSREVEQAIVQKKVNKQELLYLGIDYKSSALIQYVLQTKGFNVNAIDPRTGLTPLQMVVALAPDLTIRINEKDENLISYLIRIGAKIDGVGKAGKTPLEIAIEFGNVQAVAQLVKEGAFVSDSVLSQVIASKQSELFYELAKSHNIGTNALGAIDITNLIPSAKVDSGISLSDVDNSQTDRFKRNGSKWEKITTPKSSIHHGHSQRWSLYLAMYMQHKAMILDVLDEAQHTGVDLNTAEQDTGNSKICAKDVQNVITYALKNKDLTLLNDLKQLGISFQAIDFQAILETKDVAIIDFILETDCVVTEEHLEYLFSEKPEFVQEIFPKLFEKYKDLFLSATESNSFYALKLLGFGIEKGNSSIVDSSLTLYQEKGISVTFKELTQAVLAASKDSNYDLTPILDKLFELRRDIFYNVPQNEKGENDYTKTPLFHLIQNKHVSGVQSYIALVTGKRIPEANRKGAENINFEISSIYVDEAVKQNSPEILKILLENGGTPSDNNLTDALVKGNYKIVDLLVSHEATVTIEHINSVLGSNHSPEIKRELLGILFSSPTLSDEVKGHIETVSKNSEYRDIITRPYGQYLIAHKPTELEKHETDSSHVFQVPVEDTLIFISESTRGLDSYYREKGDISGWWEVLDLKDLFCTDGWYDDEHYPAWSSPEVGGLRTQLNTYSHLAKNGCVKDNFAAFKEHRSQTLKKSIQKVDSQLSKASTQDQRTALEKHKKRLAGELFCLQQSNSWTEFGRLTGEYVPSSTYDEVFLNTKKYEQLDEDNLQQMNWTIDAITQHPDVRYEMMQSISWDLTQSHEGRLPEIPSFSDEFRKNVEEGKNAYIAHYRDGLYNEDYDRIGWFRNLLFQGYDNQAGIYESVAKAQARIDLLTDMISAIDASPIWREVCAYHDATTNNIQFKTQGMSGVLTTMQVEDESEADKKKRRELFTYVPDLTNREIDLTDEEPSLTLALTIADKTLTELELKERQYQLVVKLVREYQEYREYCESIENAQNTLQEEPMLLVECCLPKEKAGELSLRWQGVVVRDESSGGNKFKVVQDCKFFKKDGSTVEEVKDADYCQGTVFCRVSDLPKLQEAAKGDVCYAEIRGGYIPCSKDEYNENLKCVKTDEYGTGDNPIYLKWERRYNQVIPLAGKDDRYIPEGEDLSEEIYRFVPAEQIQKWEKARTASAKNMTRSRDITFEYAEGMYLERLAMMYNYTSVMVTNKDVTANVALAGQIAIGVGTCFIPGIGAGHIAVRFLADGAIGFGAYVTVEHAITAMGSDKVNLGDFSAGDVRHVSSDEGWCPEMMASLADLCNGKPQRDIDEQIKWEEEKAKLLKQRVQERQILFDEALEYIRSREKKTTHEQFICDATDEKKVEELTRKYKGVEKLLDTSVSDEEWVERCLLKAAQTGDYFYYLFLSENKNEYAVAEENKKKFEESYKDSGADQLMAYVSASDKRIQAEIELHGRDDVIRMYQNALNTEELNLQDKKRQAQKSSVNDLILKIKSGTNKLPISENNINAETEWQKWSAEDQHTCYLDEKRDPEARRFVLGAEIPTITPLMFACVKDKSGKMIKALINGNENGKADVNQMVDTDNNPATPSLTPLLATFRMHLWKRENNKYGQIKNLQLLIENMNPTTINHADNEGKTALYYALELWTKIPKDKKDKKEDCKKIIQLLIQHGANVEDKKVQELLDEYQELKTLVDDAVKAKKLENGTAISCTSILRQSEENPLETSGQTNFMAQYGITCSDDIDRSLNTDVQRNIIS